MNPFYWKLVPAEGDRVGWQVICRSNRVVMAKGECFTELEAKYEARQFVQRFNRSNSDLFAGSHA